MMFANVFVTVVSLRLHGCIICLLYWNHLSGSRSTLLGHCMPRCSETNNRFILTIIVYCTHYPEAIPLMSHETPVAAKALTTAFSHFVFRKKFYLIVDQIVSPLMDIFLEEFGIRHIEKSPYHPECNGSCERFNGTLKSMIRAVSGYLGSNVALDLVCIS
jgi:hypothetical protein